MRTLIKGNYYHRNLLLTHSTCLTNRSTRLSTRSTVYPFVVLVCSFVASVCPLVVFVVLSVGSIYSQQYSQYYLSVLSIRSTIRSTICRSYLFVVVFVVLSVGLFIIDLKQQLPCSISESSIYNSSCEKSFLKFYQMFFYGTVSFSQPSCLSCMLLSKQLYF